MDEIRAAEVPGRVLAERGPATSGELAGRTGLSERYVREWLGGARRDGQPVQQPLRAHPVGKATAKR